MTSLFVQAVDDFFYQEPVLHDDKCFLQFDPEDGPQVSVKCFDLTSYDSGRKRARPFLRQLGIRFEISEHATQGRKLFPPSWDVMHAAMTYDLQILGPIPVPQEHKGRVSSVGGNCILYCWHYQFDSADVLNALNGHEIYGWLASFVLGHPILPFEKEGIRKGLVAELAKYESEASSNSSVVVRRTKGLSRT